MANDTKNDKNLSSQETSAAYDNLTDAAAKGAARYFGGEAAGKVADKVLDTKVGQSVVKNASKTIQKTSNPLVKQGVKFANKAGLIDGAKSAMGASRGKIADAGGGSAGNKFRNQGASPINNNVPELTEEDLENMTEEEREQLLSEMEQAQQQIQEVEPEKEKMTASKAGKLMEILKDPIKRKILIFGIIAALVIVLLFIAYIIIFRVDIVGSGPDDYVRDVGVLGGTCTDITLVKEDDDYYRTHPNDVVSNIDDVDFDEKWDSNGNGKIDASDKNRWETPETHDLEGYTKGVLQAEASHIGDVKTYEAAAITARTFALQITSKRCLTWNNENKRAAYHNPQNFTKLPARSEIVEAVGNTDRIVMSINGALLDLFDEAYYDNFCITEKVQNYEDTQYNYYRMLQENDQEKLIIYGDWVDDNVDGGSAAVDSGRWENSGKYDQQCQKNGMSLYGAKYLLNLDIQPYYPRRVLQYYYGYNIDFMRIPAQSSLAFGGGCLWWPLAGGTGRVTSKFGYRNSPTAGASSNHKGVDLATPVGTQVLAADGGKVVAAGAANGYGQWVKIDHGNGMTTIYGHLSAGGIKVSAGQTVSQGQVIALSGNTGVSTGPHLHFQVEMNGTAVDPANYISQSNTSPDCAALYSATSPTLTGGRYSGKGSKEFINYIAKYAVEDMHKSGVLASITIAQAALESGWGKSKLAANYGNYFGIKATDWSGPSVAMPTKEQTASGYEYSKVDEFRAYTSPAGSIADHSAFLNKYERYVPVINAANYRDAAWALQNATYATDGQYANKLIAIIEANELYKYDQQ